jgi:hypothetical protein
MATLISLLLTSTQLAVPKGKDEGSCAQQTVFYKRVSMERVFAINACDEATRWVRTSGSRF